MSTSKFDIASRAFVLVGGEVISSFSDGTRESTIASVLYEELVRGELASHPWRFAIKKEQLSRESAAPVGAQWAAAYQLPSDLLLLRAVKVNGSDISYGRYESKVLCDAVDSDVVVADILYRVGEQEWLPYFTSGLVFKLAAAFGGALARDGALVNAFESKALAQLRVARTMDSQSQTTTEISTTRLIVVRR
jgi:hypothetical protein